MRIETSHLEALFEVFVLFQERRVIDNDLSVRYPQFEDLVVDGLCRVNSA